MESTSDELVATRQALDKVTKEIDELRNEMKKIREGATREEPGGGFALGFNLESFNAMNYTKGLSWVAETLAVKMKEEMNQHPDYFQKYDQLGDINPQGYRVCARYNRGEDCNFSWHAHNKQGKKGKTSLREIRLHCCSLCLVALGLAAGHQIINCPWIKKETWSQIGERNS
jgi:hypothetical protein